MTIEKNDIKFYKKGIFFDFEEEKHIKIFKKIHQFNKFIFDKIVIKEYDDEKSIEFVKHYIITKQIELYNENVLNLLIGNNNSFLIILRSMYENLLLYYTINEFENSWKDWLDWNINKINFSYNTKKSEELYNDWIGSDESLNAKSWTWLKKSGVKEYNIKNIIKVTNKLDYKEFQELSDICHQINILSSVIRIINNRIFLERYLKYFTEMMENEYPYLLDEEYLKIKKNTIRYIRKLK